MATIPNPATWFPGNKLMAAQLNLEIRDSVEFLLNPPQVAAYLTTNLSAVKDVWFLIKMDGEVYDTDAMHGASTVITNVQSNSRLTANTPGLYNLTYWAGWQNASNNARAVDIRKGAAGVQTQGERVLIQYIDFVGSERATLTRSLDVRLEQGEYVEMFCFHDATPSPRNILGGVSLTGMSMRFEAV